MLKMTNPILPVGADPWLICEEQKWYFICTRGSHLELICAENPADIAGGQSKIVWVPPVSGPGSVELWAPELHHIDGKWLIYYAASDGTGDAGRRMHVVECSGADPMKDAWNYLGMINTACAGLDGTVMQHNGEKYFIYAGYGDFPEHGSALYMARMKDLCTLEGKEICLTWPEYEWERQGGMPINEGPAILKHGNRIFIIYSASTTWSEDYCLGMLTADKEADLLDTANWTKAKTPVFKKYAEHHVMAPGHNCFVKYNGEDIIVYHAIDGPGGEGDLCTGKRNPRIQKFEWRSDGTPDFGIPVACGTEITI